MIRRLMAVGAALVLSATPALAGDQDFRLRNKTGYTIEKVYVSASKTDDWEEDVMGRDVLEDGQSVDIAFARSESACKFDVKVVYDDEEEAIWSGLDLCEISTVVIRYDRKNGKTWVTTD